MLREPGGVNPPSGIAGKRYGRTGKIERITGAVTDDFDLIGVGKVLGTLERYRQCGDGGLALKSCSEGADLLAGHKWLVALDINHGLRSDGAVSLAEPIGPAGVVGASAHSLIAGFR